MPTKTFSSVVSFYRGNDSASGATKPVRAADLPWYGNAPLRNAYTAGGTSTREDNRPGWKENIRKGRDATTNVLSTKVEFHAIPGVVGSLAATTGPIPTYNYSYRKGHICDPPLTYQFGVVPSERQDLDAYLQLKFLKKAQAKLRKFNSPTFLAELHETVQMFRHPIRGIVNELSKHKGRLKKVVTRSGKLREYRTRSRQGPSRTLTRILSDQWLQTSFGLLPFVQDMDDAADALNGYFQRLWDNPVREPVKATGSRQYRRSEVDSFFSTSSGLRWKFLRTDERLETLTYRGAVKLEPYSDRVAGSVRTHFGFDWQSAVLATWEIIPYSFLVDYFVNIGDMLEAALFNQANLAWVSRSFKSEGTSYTEIAGNTVGHSTDDFPGAFVNLERKRGEGSIGRVIIRSADRVRVTWPLSVSAQFSVPGWGKRSLNLAALASLRFL